MGIHLMRDMADPNSFHAPYWAALPAKPDVGLNYETFPDAYYELLESQHLVSGGRGGGGIGGGGGWWWWRRRQCR